MAHRPAPSDEEQALLELCRLLAAADRLCPRLPTAVREQVADRICDAWCRLLEETVRWYGPRGADDVRRLEPGLRGQGLVYLLDRRFGHGQPEGVAGWRYDAWRGWLRDPDREGHADEVLADPRVRTAEDLVGWLLWHEGRLFPDLADDDEVGDE